VSCCWIQRVPAEEPLNDDDEQLQPRIGLSYQMDDKTVLHANGGIVYEGLSGLSTDYFSFYYNSNTFNQISTLDAKHWIRELGNDHGLRTFPTQPGNINLGFNPPVTTNADYGFQTFGGSANPDQGGSSLLSNCKIPEDYMWGPRCSTGDQPKLDDLRGVSGDPGIHLLIPTSGWSPNNIPLSYRRVGRSGITGMGSQGDTCAYAAGRRGCHVPGAALRWSLLNKNYVKSGKSYGNALFANGAFVNLSAAGIFRSQSFARTPDYSIGASPFVFPNVRNPGDFSSDATLLKKFYLNGDRTRYLEARIEATNVFNRATYGLIDRDPDSLTFGGVNGKTGNRVMQMTHGCSSRCLCISAFTRVPREQESMCH